MTRSRGFTLVELLVVTAVAGIAFTLATGTFLAQHRVYEAQEVSRTTQQAAREATLALERALRMAGFGVDPRIAFDFRHYRCTTSPCRDATAGPDEVVFVSRSPRYTYEPPGGSCLRAVGCYTGDAWHVEQASPSSLRITVRGGESFRRGQLLLVSCAAATARTIVRLDRPPAPPAGPGSLDLPLMSAQAGNPYQENALGDACFGSGQATAFQLDRSRFFIDRTGEFPYLLLDRGEDLDGDGTLPDEGDLDDLLPIARGIEELQIAYVLEPGAGFTAPDSNRNWVIGDAPGTREEPNPAAPGPDYGTAIDDIRRFTLHPANVKAVRLTIGAVSTRPDPAPPAGWTGDRLVLQENRNQWNEPPARRRRAVVRTTVLTRNLGSRAFFLF